MACSLRGDIYLLLECHRAENHQPRRLQRKGLLEKFIADWWPNGSSPEGRRRINSLARVERYNKSKEATKETEPSTDVKTVGAVGKTAHAVRTSLLAKATMATFWWYMTDIKGEKSSYSSVALLQGHRLLFSAARSPSAGPLAFPTSQIR